jgi:hypothetical protein
MHSPPRRLTISQTGLTYPLRFGTPYGTVAFKVEGDVLYVFVQTPAYALDWDIAQGLMARLSDPLIQVPGVVASALRGVRCWQVELVDRAAEYLI